MAVCCWMSPAISCAKSVTNSKTGMADLLVGCAKQQVAVCDPPASREGTGEYHEQAA
ncbi:MAG: hypothetical protein ACXWTY_08310 [Methylobacter sp.]